MNHTLPARRAGDVFVSIVNCWKMFAHIKKKKIRRRRIKVIFFFFEFNTGAISSCISTEQKGPLYLKTVYDGRGGKIKSFNPN